MCMPQPVISGLTLNLLEIRATKATDTIQVTTSAPAGNSGTGVLVVEDELDVEVVADVADDVTANSTTLLLPPSLTQTLPEGSTAIPSGAVRSVAVAFCT